MHSDPISEPDPEVIPEIDPNAEELDDPDPRMARIKKIARTIETRVRKVLTDTESDKDTPSGGTEVSPPLPSQP